MKEAKADYEQGWAWARFDASKVTAERLAEIINKGTPFKASVKKK